MDLSESAELQAIFRDEVVERAAALVQGGKMMADHPLAPPEVGDRRRDAHTIKGNALVMGYPCMAEAAKLIERALRDVGEIGRVQTPQLANAIESAAAALPDAVQTERHGEPRVLMQAIESLRIVLDEADKPPTQESTAPTVDVRPQEPGPATEMPTPQPMIEQPLDHGLEVGGGLENFGGLTAELQLALEGETTRVDSARVYELINKVVDMRLDAQAMVSAISGLERDIAHTQPVATGLKVRNLEAAATRFFAAVGDLEKSALALPSVSFGEVTSTFDQLVRFLSRRLNKDVTLRVVGDDLLVDRQLVDRLREPLRHLVVNAVAHGVEAASERLAAEKPPTALVVVEVKAVEHQIQVTVSDDGCGIDWAKVDEAAIEKDLLTTTGADQGALQRLLFTRGFTTVAQSDEVSGDGLGLAMAAELVESLNGGISISSERGKGTAVRLTLPSSLALQGVLVVEAGGHRWGIPMAAVDTTVVVVGESLDGVRYRNTDLPVKPLAHALGLEVTDPPGEVIVLTTRGGLHAFSVPRVLGRRQVAVKDIGPMLGGSKLLGGAAVLGGGRVIGILEPTALTSTAASAAPVPNRRRLLVVDDSRGARQLVAAALGSAGFEVTSAGDAAEAIVALDKDAFDAVVCDFSMPDHSGVELVKVLRQRLPTLPVVMVSGVATPEDQSAAYAAGVNAYLDKSDFREGVLASTLRQLLGLEDEGTPS